MQSEALVKQVEELENPLNIFEHEYLRKHIEYLVKLYELKLVLEQVVKIAETVHGLAKIVDRENIVYEYYEIERTFKNVVNLEEDLRKVPELLRKLKLWLHNIKGRLQQELEKQ